MFFIIWDFCIHVDSGFENNNSFHKRTGVSWTSGTHVVIHTTSKHILILISINGRKLIASQCRLGYAKPNLLSFLLWARFWLILFISSSIFFSSAKWWTNYGTGILFGGFVNVRRLWFGRVSDNTHFSTFAHSFWEHSVLLFLLLLHSSGKAELDWFICIIISKLVSGWNTMKIVWSVYVKVCVSVCVMVWYSWSFPIFGLRIV